ncbi:MAG: hypothetical protein OXI05_11145, partial [Bacteroidota bacterium]|nr:hypothetical protein [Bacteroidota bacterium]
CWRWRVSKIIFPVSQSAGGRPISVNLFDRQGNIVPFDKFSACVVLLPKIEIWKTSSESFLSWHIVVQSPGPLDSVRI